MSELNDPRVLFAAERTLLAGGGEAMQIIRFKTGQLPELTGTPSADEEAGVFYWLDVQRSETDWHKSARPWLRMRLDERHVSGYA